MRKQRFAALLRDAMARQNVGPRELGRRLDPANPPSGQRNVFRYLAAKTLPADPIRTALESALGIEHGSLAVEEVSPSGDTFRGGARADVLASDGAGGGASVPAGARDAAGNADVSGEAA